MQKHWSRFFTLSLSLSLLIMVLSTCGAGTFGSGEGNGSSPTGSTTIKIATDYPVSGKDTSSGKPAENGAHLAVDQANQIGAYSAGSYDAAMVMIQAIKTVIKKGIKTPGDSSDTAQAKVFRQAIIDAIQGISYDGITGHIAFDKNGDTTSRVISIYTIADDPKQGSGWKFITQLNV